MLVGAGKLNSTLEHNLNGNWRIQTSLTLSAGAESLSMLIYLLSSVIFFLQIFLKAW